MDHNRRHLFALVASPSAEEPQWMKVGYNVNLGNVLGLRQGDRIVTLQTDDYVAYGTAELGNSFNRVGTRLMRKLGFPVDIVHGRVVILTRPPLGASCGQALPLETKRNICSQIIKNV